MISVTCVTKRLTLMRICSYTVEYPKPWNQVKDGICDIRVEDYELSIDYKTRRDKK